ncbi:imelysin family protein [Chitinibacteraceae bacterium HSL-7]
MKLLLACALLPLAVHAAPPTPEAATRWLDSGYLVRHTALAAAVDTLASSSTAFCRAPDDAALTALRRDWLAALTAWRTMDGASAGPMVLERLGRKIDFRPTRTADIEKRISAGKGVDERNVSVRGFAAIEYLLYGDDAPAAQLARLKAPARCTYLVSSAAQIKTDVHQLDAGWRVYREELAAENPFFREQMQSETLGLMAGAVESTSRRLPRVEDADASAWPDWRAHSTRGLMLAQLGGTRTAFFAEGGIRDALVAAGQTGLAERAVTLFDQSEARISALPANAQTAARDDVDAVRAQLQKLKQFLLADVAGALDLTLGFAASDGD